MTNSRNCVLQNWVVELPMMQQTVLLTAIRGPDGLPKYGPAKMLLRWYRRCVLKCSFGHIILDNPYDQRGGSFTGPSVNPTDCGNGWIDAMNDLVIGPYLRELDAIPHHFQLHLLHASEILGYKHPDLIIHHWWFSVYRALVEDMHLYPETQEEMDKRLSDNEDAWRERNHVATQD